MSNSEYIKLRSMIRQLEERMDRLEESFRNVETVQNADIRESSIRTDMQELESDIQDLNERLAMVKLPDETRYYLNQSEIKYIRKLAKEVHTLKAETERVLQQLLSKLQYADRID